MPLHLCTAELMERSKKRPTPGQDALKEALIPSTENASIFLSGSHGAQEPQQPVKFTFASGQEETVISPSARGKLFARAYAEDTEGLADREYYYETWQKHRSGISSFCRRKYEWWRSVAPEGEKPVRLPTSENASFRNRIQRISVHSGQVV